MTGSACQKTLADNRCGMLLTQVRRLRIAAHLTGSYEAGLVEKEQSYRSPGRLLTSKHHLLMPGICYISFSPILCN